MATKLKDVSIQSSERKDFLSKLPNWNEEFRNADISTKHMILISPIDKVIVKDDDIKIIFKSIFKIRLESF